MMYNNIVDNTGGFFMTEDELYEKGKEDSRNDIDVNIIRSTLTSDEFDVYLSGHIEITIWEKWNV